ncbi:VOC family protein [Frankia sp. CNm7]|uniref:VOC family protein n=1 Tax=Frankia nepalensis TaxID=1836974 RepID=A0A937RLY5_9ACTN|nr:VOC family protein [Frankia nepalensis]MBL7499981.1 VOC family protein [Frankia nepalensis]MBL7512514.1 VOC family protein [Frankia nepalensis]MBL7517433.1 VOC family protein [Frankia nepalensis]MBL7632817.1 VOC family protein [Frankia nepalensis]
MPTLDTAITGAPIWIDLMTSDPAASQSFYGELFGWTAGEPSEEFGGYFNFLRNGQAIAGGMQSQPEMGGVPDVWSVYLRTDDAEKAVAAAVEKGGQVIASVMPVGDLGIMAVVADPAGAVIGMWQPGLHTGLSAISEPGAPAHFELHTRDYAPSLDFYRDVFGWTTATAADEENFKYTIVPGSAGEPLAGVMDATAFLPDGVPAHWSVYFATEDVDATLAKAVELGGKIVQAAEDTPYGRLATATDATGAVFKLVGPNNAPFSPPVA